MWSVMIISTYILFGIIKEYLNVDFEKYISEWFPNAKRVGNGIGRLEIFKIANSKRMAVLLYLTLEKSMQRILQREKRLVI